MPQAGYQIKTINVQGVPAQDNCENIARNAAAAFWAVASGIECAKIIKQFKPDIAIGTGGYVSGPVLRKAAKLGIPVLIHEAKRLPPA